MARIKFSLIFIACLVCMMAIFGAINEDDNNVRTYYNFSNVGLDATGRFVTITATGTPTTVVGISGDGKAFDGSENYDVDSNPVSAYPFTFNAWIKTNTSHTTAGIVAMGHSGANNQYVFLGIDGGKATATVRNTVPNSAVSINRVNVSKWVMVTAVFNSATDRRIYVNGTNEANDTTSVTLGTNNRFAVGQNADNQADQFYTGNIDEVSVWNKTLTSADIEELYNIGIGKFWNFAGPTDSCTPPAINNTWTINMNDSCYITTGVELGTGNITFTGSFGNATFNTSINISNMDFPPVATKLFITANAGVNIG